jgi:hypothetical protein
MLSECVAKCVANWPRTRIDERFYLVGLESGSHWIRQFANKYAVPSALARVIDATISMMIRILANLVRHMLLIKLS